MRRSGVVGERARALRGRETPAERKLWGVLRNRQVEQAKFRRQHGVGRFVADFVCVEVRVIVEADGGQHCECLGDVVRTEWLEREGWVVVRFWNDEILLGLEGVVERIAAVVRERSGCGPASSSPSPNLSPEGGGEE